MTDTVNYARYSGCHPVFDIDEDGPGSVCSKSGFYECAIHLCGFVSTRSFSRRALRVMDIGLQLVECEEGYTL